MKKTLTFLVLTMFLFSFGIVFAAPENTGAQDETGPNHDKVISAGGQNGTGAEDGTGYGTQTDRFQNENGSGNTNREKVVNQGTGQPRGLISQHKNFAPNSSMNLGQCKAGFAKDKTACMKESQTKQKECKIQARSSTDRKTALKSCISDYKNETSQCKATLKLGKTECGNLIPKKTA